MALTQERSKELFDYRDGNLIYQAFGGSAINFKRW